MSHTAASASQNFCPKCSATLTASDVERRACSSCGKKFEKPATAPRTRTLRTTGRMLGVSMGSSKGK